jgi:hypothetical protein
MSTQPGSGGVKVPARMREILGTPGFIGGRRGYSSQENESLILIRAPVETVGDTLRNLYSSGELDYWCLNTDL